MIEPEKQAYKDNRQQCEAVITDPPACNFHEQQSVHCYLRIVIQHVQIAQNSYPVRSFAMLKNCIKLRGSTDLRRLHAVLNGYSVPSIGTRIPSGAALP